MDHRKRSYSWSRGTEDAPAPVRAECRQGAPSPSDRQQHPLILAAAEPLASIYRSVNTYSHLANAAIEGSPVERAILDGIYRDELAAWRNLFEACASEGRATADIARAARAATIGAVDSILVDIDEVIPGRIDERGAIVFAEQASPSNY